MMPVDEKTTHAGPEDEPAPLPHRRRGLSIAIWVPALVGLTVVLMLGAFTSLGMAAPSFSTLL